MSSSDRVVTDKVLFSLLRMGAETAKSVASKNGTFGEAVQNAVESKHLHKGAFSFINRLNKMDEAKRNDFLLSLPIYLEKMEKVWQQGGHVGDFVQQAEEQERDEERARQAAQSDQERDDSVARIETGIKGVPDPDHPDDPDKVTTIADARKKREGKAKGKADPAPVAAADAGPVLKPGRAGRGGKPDHKAAAERAFKRQDDKMTATDAAQDQVDEAHAEGQRRYDAQGNTMPHDISGDEFAGEDVDGEASEPIGMPGSDVDADGHPLH